LGQEIDISKTFSQLEEIIARTGSLFDTLVDSQGQSLRLEYASGPRYMCMVRQRDDNEATVGVYWRVFQFVGSERRRVWKKSFSLTRVPPTVVKKMPESSRSRYSEVLRIAKKFGISGRI
jgi:hypothetical protein